MTNEEIVKQLKKKELEDGRKSQLITNCIIQAVHITEKEREDGDGTRTQISITTDKEFDNYVLDNKTGEYVPGKTKFVFPSYIGLVSLLKGTEAGGIIDKFTMNDDAFKLIIHGAKVDILQEPVAKGEQYINLWSTRVNEPYEAKNDAWYAHVIKIELSDEAKKFIYKMKCQVFGLIPTVNM